MHWPSPRRALVIAVVSTLVGCSTHALPTTAPGTRDNPLRLMVTSSALPLVIDAASAYPDSQFSLEVRTGDYRQAVAALRRGEAHLIVSTHLDATDSTSLWAAPIADDAIALITHLSNPVTDLTAAQIRQIYQGQVTDWRTVGGLTLPLRVISREMGSGIRAEFEQALMGTRRTTGTALAAASSDGVLRLVREMPEALGYVSLAAVDSSVNVLAIDGIIPSLETLADRRYPLRSTVFVIGMAEPEGAARAFIGWLQSPDGQDALKRRYRPVLSTTLMP